jgi:hypothetical protein
MMRLELLLGLAAFAVWGWGLIDVLRPREVESRRLSQDRWVPVVFIGLVPGALAWLLLGRPESMTDPKRHEAIAAPSDEDEQSIEEFRARVRARAEEQRRRYAEQQAREPRPEAG